MRYGLRRAPRSCFQRSGISADSRMASQRTSTGRRLVMLSMDAWHEAIQDALEQADSPGRAKRDPPRPAIAPVLDRA